MPKSRNTFFFRVGPLRAMLETVLLAIALWGGMLLTFGLFNPSTGWLNSYVLVNPLCMLWCSVRLRPSSLQSSKGNWWQRRLVELLICSCLSIALAFLFLLVPVPLINLQVRADWSPGILPVAAALNYVVFIAGRIGAKALLFWDRLRRTQLIWGLAHTQVMLIAIGSAILIFIIDMVLILTNKGSGVTIIFTTLGLIVMSIIAMAAVVPPSALFLYFAMRRTISRLQTLTMATGTLRGGNYAIRVPVSGEDEVAQLQTDFNAMAADLERAMRELQNERDVVSSLLQSRRELFASVSHELRTPVATLRGYLETTLMHWNEISPQTLHHDMRVMEDEVIRLQKLVEDLFTLARTEVGRLSLQCKPTNVGDIVMHLVDANAPLVWQKNRIELVAEVPGDVPPALVDPARLEQALQNLLHNGVRHTPPGGIIAVVVVKKPGAVEIQVKDTGEGIAPQDLPHIWQRFYQAKHSQIGAGGGTGLGLALVKEWVEGMGGSVAVESILGEGSCFSLRFRINEQAKSPENELDISIPHTD
jgi:signal transduction histidine kinase